jgi:hypothetical protein
MQKHSRPCEANLAAISLQPAPHRPVEITAVTLQFKLARGEDVQGVLMLTTTGNRTDHFRGHALLERLRVSRSHNHDVLPGICSGLFSDLLLSP